MNEAVPSLCGVVPLNLLPADSEGLPWIVDPAWWDGRFLVN